MVVFSLFSGVCCWVGCLSLIGAIINRPALALPCSACPPILPWRFPPTGYVLPDRPSLPFRKEAKETQGLRPYVPAKVKGRVTTVLHLILRTGAKTLTPDVVVLETSMVKGGGSS